MTVLKCKMCGGNLNVEEGATICTCEFCGTTQTIPVLDDEKKNKLYERANRLRFNNEFDKAYSVYQDIVNDFPEEAEAYWGLLLCKYGIEYVEDPYTHKRIPTCHRSSFESIFDDDNFEMVMENSDLTAKEVYRSEAKKIEEIRKGILEISNKEDPYDIFICYKESDEYNNRTVDSVIAQNVFDALTEKGYRVFFSRISLEDKLGQEYEPYIFAALNSAKVMLVFGTKYDYFNAVWVKNEWSRFLQLIAKGEKKTIIPCYRDIDAYDMPKEFQHLQAQDMAKVGAIQDLLRGIEKIDLIQKTKTNIQESMANNSSVNIDALLKRANIYLEDQNYEKALEYYDKVLDIYPECGEAYFGLLLSSFESSSINDLTRNYDFEDVFENNKYLKIISRIELYGNDQIKNEIKKLYDWKEAELIRYAEIDKEREKQKRIEEEKKRIEQEKQKRSDFFNTVISRLNNDKWLGDEYCIKNIISFCDANGDLPKAQFYKDKAKQELEKLISKKKDEIQELETKKLNNEEQAFDTTQIDNELSKTNNDLESLKKDLLLLNNQIKELGVFEIAKRTEAKEKIQQIDAQIDELEKKRKEFQEQKTKVEEIERIHQKLLQKKESLSNDLLFINQKAGNDKDNDFSELLQRLKQINPFFSDTHKKGDLVSFGRYFQDKVGRIYKEENVTKKPIDWIIIDMKEDKALLISKYALDCKIYHSKQESVTWEECSLRKWLNDDFYKKAFNTEEKNRIIETNIPAHKNPSYPSSPGSNTKDNMFILSVDEAFNYMKTELRICKATDFAIARNAWVEEKSGLCYWWLRTPGENNKKAVNINHEGKFGLDGMDVGGVLIYNKCLIPAVRPSMWVQIESN